MKNMTVSISGSVEMRIKYHMTFLGQLIVAGKRGLIGETISMVSICLPFPQGRANWRRFLKIFEFSAVPSIRAELKNYSQRNSFEPFAPAAWASPPITIIGQGALARIFTDISPPIPQRYLMKMRISTERIFHHILFWTSQIINGDKCWQRII